MADTPENKTVNTAVLGFGNPVREDDGVGIYVIDELRKRLGDDSPVSIFDMGTSAFEVLFKLKGHERIILVDAVLNSGEEVGSIFKLPAAEVEAQIVDDPMVFLHSLKWDQALSYARKMLREDYPEQIDVFLVAIDSVRFNVGMTEAAIAGGDRLVDLLVEELEMHNTTSSPRVS